MKNHHSIIKMIVIIAALAGLGFIAFKHYHNAKSTTTTDSVVIQGTNPAGAACTPMAFGIPNQCANGLTCITTTPTATSGVCGPSGGYEYSKQK